MPVVHPLQEEKELPCVRMPGNRRKDHRQAGEQIRLHAFLLPHELHHLRPQMHGGRAHVAYFGKRQMRKVGDEDARIVGRGKTLAWLEGLRPR